jgi:small subunit ribosomal protein S2
MPVVTRRELLEAGVHFGHQTRRWNPKMARYLYGERSGIYIIDLEKSLSGLEEAYAFTRDLSRRGGLILFVGTKKQAQEPIAAQAERVDMPYVITRWLGGMLTNFQTISRRLVRMRELRQMEATGAFESLPKKEVLRLKHEKEKLERNLGGFQELDRLPDAVFVIDTKKEHIAVNEARKLGLPVIAIVDTNCDPDEVDYVIPGNDDAIRSVNLVTRVIADAIAEGRTDGRTRIISGALGAESDSTDPSRPSEAGGGGDVARTPPEPPSDDDIVPEPAQAGAPAEPEAALDRGATGGAGATTTGATTAGAAGAATERA